MLDNNGSIITCYVYQQLTGFLATQRTGSNRNQLEYREPKSCEIPVHFIRSPF